VAALFALVGCRLPWRRAVPTAAKVSPRDQFNEGYRLVLKGQYAAAVPRLEPLALAGRPGAEYRHDAAFWLGYAYQEMGLALEAGAWYRRAIEDAPNGRYADLARERLAWLRSPPSHARP